MKKRNLLKICAATFILANIISCTKDNDTVSFLENENITTTKVVIREILEIDMESAGTLAEKIGEENNTVQKLIITGPINAIDVNTIRNLPALLALDLKAATICGGEETYTSSHGNLEYQLYDNEIGSYMFYSMNLEEIILPDNITAINDHAFSQLQGTEENPFTSITIPEGVTIIREYAFEGCDNLESVTCPSTLEEIESYVFDHCDNLQNVDLGGVVRIGQEAFKQCESLKTIELPESVETLGYRCFYSSGLTSIVIPESVTIFEDSNDPTNRVGTFENCKELTSVTLPSNMTEIPSYMFYLCSALESIHIPESVTTISECAFRECTSLTSIQTPAALESIGNYAFYNCTKLTDVSFSDNLKSIGEGTFAGCAIKNITLPNSVENLYQSCFQNCKSLQTVTFSNKLTSIPVACFYECTALKSIALPESITRIEENGFAVCSSLSDVKLSDNLNYIGTSAFHATSSLESITFPESVETIEKSAFDQSGLLEINLPDNVKRLGDGVFANTKIKTITIPASVESTGRQIFYGCTHLTSIFWDSHSNTGSMLFHEVGGYVNCLIYVSDPAVVVADTHTPNIIVNGVADEIVLYSSDFDFNVPEEFKALKIKYIQDFTYPTYLGQAAGWRSISLPFAPTNITHADGRVLAPFNADVENAKPFWLRRLTANGFENVTAIEANIPYIIAMPNNEAYDAEYNISGQVTFSAEDPYGITIPATSDMIVDNGPEFALHSNFVNTPASTTIYALNGDPYKNPVLGSVFVRNERTTKPFEGYVTSLGTTTKAPAFFSLDAGRPATRAAKPLGPVPSIDDM